MPEQHYRPQTYRSRDSVGYLIRRLYTLLLARFEGALAQADFTLTQWIVLIQLREGVARTASDLASDLDHDSGAITRVLDQLERRGFLQRRRSSQDRRVVELRLTSAGKAIAEELLPLVVDQTNAALAPLSKPEFVQLHGYLVRLLDHAQTAGTTESEPSASRRRGTSKVGTKPAAPRPQARTVAEPPSRLRSRSRRRCACLTPGSQAMSADHLPSLPLRWLTPLVATAMLLAACVSDPVDSTHEKPLAASDIGLSGPASAPRPDAAWWHELHDPQLDQLIATALARNPSLAGSLARVRIAREQARVAGSAAKPQVTLDGFEYRQRFSENYIIPPPYGGGTFWEGRLALNLNWHLDFWGRQAALVEQSGRIADATVLDAAMAELHAVQRSRAGLSRACARATHGTGRPAGTGAAQRAARPHHATVRRRARVQGRDAGGREQPGTKRGRHRAGATGRGDGTQRARGADRNECGHSTHAVATDDRLRPGAAGARCVAR